MELNKIAAAVLLGGLVAMISGLFADILYHPDHHREGEKRGYSIDVPEEGAKVVEVVEVPIAERMLLANLDKGKREFKKCVSCHTVEKDGAHKTGPNLWNRVGNKIAYSADYPYSDVLGKMGGVWSYEDLDAFLKKPKTYAPGTKMSFIGLKKPEARANVILYLRSLSDKPAPLPQ